jgi:hypothetical protein
MTGSPVLTANPLLGMATLRENALALIRWQPVQWHAIVINGGRLISNRTRLSHVAPLALRGIPYAPLRLQRHPPCQGSFHSFMAVPSCAST